MGVIKDVFPDGIVSYSVSDLMKSRIAVDSAVARRGEVPGWIVHLAALLRVEADGEA